MRTARTLNESNQLPSHTSTSYVSRINLPDANLDNSSNKRPKIACNRSKSDQWRLLTTQSARSGTVPPSPCYSYVGFWRGDSASNLLVLRTSHAGQTKERLSPLCFVFAPCLPSPTPPTPAATSQSAPPPPTHTHTLQSAHPVQLACCKLANECISCPFSLNNWASE